jgi:BirA family biotin operon repressor/biotin-[acetyl-CoA-carboxylase] ligase
MPKPPPDATFITNPPIFPPVIHLNEVTTVLDLAWEMVEKDELPFWGSILAKSQTQGRGQKGRVWVSPPGHVYAAFRLPPTPPFSGSLASVALGFALVEALKDEGVMVLLKWPNDLLVPEGKAGGILLENRKGTLIAGIGLNLGFSPFPADQRDPEAPLPAAFPLNLGPPEELWLRLAKNVMCRYNCDFPARNSDWARSFCSLAEKSLAGLGQVVTIRQPVTEPRSDRSFLTGTLAGLAPSGALRLVGPEGESAVWSGTLILPNTAHRRESP